MAQHATATRKEWLAARLELLEAEKQLLVYHFMFGPDYTAGCPSCSMIADGFNGIAVHLANHDVMLWAVSRVPLAKLQAYKRRLGWTFPWASSAGGDFNFDFNVSITKEQQLAGGSEYNYERAGHAIERNPPPPPVASSITPIRRTRADWTASGACTNGSIARPMDETSRTASGGGATTSTKSGERKNGYHRGVSHPSNGLETAGKRRPIVDTHIHFYRPSRRGGVPWPPAGSALHRDVLPAEYKALAQANGIVAAGVVEASVLVDDNQWILDLVAGDSFFPFFVG